MPRILARAGVLVALLTAPTLALAAYNDVTLTADTTILSVNGITLNVTGSGATIESITVNATDFTASLPPNSSITVTAPSGNQMNVSIDQTAGLSQVCTSSSSTFTVSASASTNITVAPVSATCPLSTTASSGSGGGNGPPVSSGGGGGGGSVIIPSTTPTPAAPVSGLSETQVQSILSLLASFGADASVIANVNASLRGQASAPGSAPGAKFATLTLALKKGSTGAQVKVLQQMLNADSSTQVAASGIGSPGNETTLFGAATLAAVQKFQVKWQIAKPGDAGYGNLGPKTRAKLNALYSK